MIEFLLGLSPGLLVASVIIAFIALVSQMALYAKAGQPPIAALVPVWNVVVFCKVVGRPAKHALFLILPGLVMIGALAAYWPVIDGLFPVHGADGELMPGPSSMADATIPFVIIGVAAIPLAWIVVQMFIEVCDSFGKHSTADKLMCVFFNGAYILFVLGISNAMYESGWWSRKRGKQYYMPDFKHKGKKFLVTPEKAVTKDADWKKDKLTVKILDKGADPIRTGEDPGDGAEVVIEGTENFQKTVERKVLAFNEGQGSYAEKVDEIKAEQVEDLKGELKEKEESKQVESNVKEVPAEESEPKVEEQKAEEPKADDSADEKKSGGKLADTQKKFSKKANEGKPKESSGKTWREEMLEKYKKQK